MATTPGIYEVDPVSRIEGHLGVKVTTGSDGKITEADAHGNLWRGFENFLVGRRVNDAITFTQRICGVCPVPHGTAATLAADSVMGISTGYATFDEAIQPGGAGIPRAAVLIRNMVLANEFLMSSITHFYHLVALDYIQGPNMAPWTPYFPDAQYHASLRNSKNGISPLRALPTLDSPTTGVPTDLWSAVIKQYVKALRIRRLTFEAGAMFAGRMPMMSMSIAGGTTNMFRSTADFQAKVATYQKIMTEVGEFVVREYVPLVFALGALYGDFDNSQAGSSVTGNYIKLVAVAGGTAGDGITVTYVAPGTPTASLTVGVVGSAITVNLATGSGSAPITTASQAVAAIAASFDASALVSPMIATGDGTQVLTALATATTSGGSAFANGYGAGVGNFLAWGAFPSTAASSSSKGTLKIKGGWVLNSDNAGITWPTVGGNYDVAGTDGANTKSGKLLESIDNLTNAQNAVKDFLKESIARARYKDPLNEFGTAKSAYPGDVTRTVPDRLSSDGYSWMKAPRWGGYPMEVGPFARMVVNGLYVTDGSQLFTRQGVGGARITDVYGSVYFSAPGVLETKVIHPDLVHGLLGSNPVDATPANNTELLTTVQSYLAKQRGGLSTMDRLRGRAIESLHIVTFLLGMPNKPTLALRPDGAMSFANDGWISELAGLTPSGTKFFANDVVPNTAVTDGYGLTEAPRGALGHFVTAANGQIQSYQCVVPTTWNGSPKDMNGAVKAVTDTTMQSVAGPHRGPMEQSMVGVLFDDSQTLTVATEARISGVEVLRVAHSFDPCIACAIH